MDIDRFFTLLLQEIEEKPFLRDYYRFLNKDSTFLFRKGYYCQRLQYIADHITNKKGEIWDCGCGYGTTGIFLALNGYNVYGTTLEYYYDLIPQRLDYWKKHGDITSFTADYKNIFDHTSPQNKFDYIITQDTLHHMEPIDDALDILSSSLSSSGKLIVIEENGRNIIQNLKLFLQRGNKRIIEIYDEKLKKKIQLGNENIRSLERWEKILSSRQLEIEKESIEYVRLFPPFAFNSSNYQNILSKEKRLWQKFPLLKNYFYQGINFLANKV